MIEDLPSYHLELYCEVCHQDPLFGHVAIDEEELTIHIYCLEHLPEDLVEILELTNE